VALATSRVAGLAAAERSGQEGPVVLVQGDSGPGNFMYAGGRVVAVVDWELAHLGDPMDDIAWLTLRATQEPFPDLPARVGEYEALSGHAIDEPRVRYYQVMAEAKLQVMAHRPGGMAARFDSAEGGGRRHRQRPHLRRAASPPLVRGLGSRRRARAHAGRAS
jgi:aminoglycoside phosphotransferase (APT) family kinase protein